MAGIPWYEVGRGLNTLADGLNKVDHKQTDRQKTLEEMVNRRAEALRRADELRLRREEAERAREEADRKREQADREAKAQADISAALEKGIPMGQGPAALATGRPDALMGMRGPEEPQAELYRPADEQDILSLAARAMTPYQTATMMQRPAMYGLQHGYRMDEIGARGDIQMRIAMNRTAANERLARIRKSEIAGDWAGVMQSSQENLLEVEQDIQQLEAAKPKHSWDMAPWNAEMGRLVSERKYHLGWVNRARTKLPPPSSAPAGAPASSAPFYLAPGAAPAPAPAPAGRKPVYNPATRRLE